VINRITGLTKQKHTHLFIPAKTAGNSEINPHGNPAKNPAGKQNQGKQAKPRKNIMGNNPRKQNSPKKSYRQNEKKLKEQQKNKSKKQFYLTHIKTSEKTI
jgi:hypothetical protein